MRVPLSHALDVGEVRVETVFGYDPPDRVTRWEDHVRDVVQDPDREESIDERVQVLRGHRVA